MNCLQELITSALKGQNNLTRAQSENALMKLREANPCDFLLECSRIMSDDHKNTFIRQSAGTVLGRSSITKTGGGFLYWDFLNESLKAKIRDNIINILISNEPLIVNIGASTLSQIASIEISRGNWLDLIDIFAENVQNLDFNVRRASILSIGYLCERLKGAQASINSKCCEQVLGSIIVGVREKKWPNIIETAYKALSNSICFLNPILQDKQVRTETIKIIMQNINDEKYYELCYESLFQFCKVCYSELNDYLDIIVEMSISHLTGRGRLSILCLELWDTIGTEYLDRMEQIKTRVKHHNHNYNVIQNYLEMVTEKLLNYILQCTIISKNENEPELQQSAVKTLGTFVESGNKMIIKLITNGVSCVINSQDANERQASALIFSALCESEDKEEVRNVFINGFQHLFALLSEQNTLVIQNTLKGFCRMLEVLGEVVIWHRNNKVIVQKFIDLIETKDREICFLALQCMVFITQSLIQDTNSLLGQNLQFLLSILVGYYDKNLIKFHEDFKEGNEKVTLIILNLIMSSNNEEILLKLIEFAIGKYYFIRDRKVNDEEIIIAGILSILQTCLLRVRNTIMTNEGPLLGVICGVLDAHLLKYGIEQEGLSIMSALVLTFKTKFEGKMEDYWRFVLHGIEMTNDSSIFKNALLVVGDCSRTYSMNFIQKSKYVIDRLFQFIQKNIVLQQKIAILTCIGDLMLSMKGEGQLCLQHCLNIVNQCFTAIYQMQKDPTQFESVQQLKEAVIEMYSCLVFALNSNKQSNKDLVLHFPEIATFVVKSCDPSLNPTVSYLKSCLYLIFDCAAFYLAGNPSLKMFLLKITDSVQVNGLINILKGIKNQSEVEELVGLINLWKTKNPC